MQERLVPFRITQIVMYGFYQAAKELLFLFLANCRQKVKLNGMFSDSENVNHCVPQGTILGPLLFHVNDFLSKTNTMEKVIQFADHTSFVCCGQKSSLDGKVK